MSGEDGSDKARAAGRVGTGLFVSPEVRAAIERSKEGDESATDLLIRGHESWRKDWDEQKPGSVFAGIRRTPAAALSMACTFGAIAYGVTQMFARDSVKQQYAMRARIGFQGLTVALLMYAAVPMILERQRKKEGYFPTVDLDGKIMPETVKKEQ